MNNYTWEDDIMVGLTRVKVFMDFLRKERGQLYAIIIALMLELENREMELPPIELMNQLGEEYFIMVAPDDSGSWKVKLLPREINVGGEDEG